MDVGYTNVLGDKLCARFEHVYFLPVDLLVSPVYGPDPSKNNTIVYEEHIIFCNAPNNKMKSSSRSLVYNRNVESRPIPS
ncbi:unnamed protein product [Rotaria sordida]|uniref:Uncharacterized protein n=1 Tax=Rotaria sordida TaxID=392033 RepID=A0A815F0V5_9BILA|nr:unnamed protein product [Rotaria sordida]CAF1584391.1 unnamed protein product [Rotaria sordida]